MRIYYSKLPSMAHLHFFRVCSLLSKELIFVFLLESIRIRVPYGARVGTVRSTADALRACKHPFKNRR